MLANHSNQIVTNKRAESTKTIVVHEPPPPTHDVVDVHNIDRMPVEACRIQDQCNGDTILGKVTGRRHFSN